jgi:hypothetical protein
VSESASEETDPIAKGSKAQAPIRVFNRSDRVWIFGYVRMIPLMLLFGGLFGLFLINEHVGGLTMAIAIPASLVVLVGPFVLDRLTALNPVNYIWLSYDLQVIRLAGRKRAYPPKRILAVEFALPDGEDYDDREVALRLTEVTFRLQGAAAVHLTASHESAVAIAVRARSWGRPILESPLRGDGSDHVPG